MRIESIQYFLSLYRNGSIHSAAKEMYISTQGLSQAIQQLESDLNVSLFYRHGKQLQLTAAGGKFLHYAENICSLYDTMKHELEDFSQNAAIEPIELLTLYATPIISHTFLSRILSIFQKRFSFQPVRVVELDAESLLKDTEFNSHSIGIIQSPLHLLEESEILKKKNAKFVNLLTSNLMIAVSPSSPLADKSVITKSDLKDLPISIYGHEYNLVQRLLPSLNEPTIAFNSGNLTLCREHIYNTKTFGFTNNVIEKYVRKPELIAIPFEEDIQLYTGYLCNPSCELHPIIQELTFILNAEFSKCDGK